jgi:subtilisin family serine protease
LTVTFDAAGSTDPQGFALTYAWTFGDGATASGAVVSHTYQNHGSYPASVAVSDGHNTTTLTPINISITPAPPVASPLSIQVNVLGVAPTVVPAQISASDRESLSLTFTITTPPTVGTATINSSSGVISYSVPGFVTGAADSFTVGVANLGASTSTSVSVTLNYDPLLPNQWYIANTGQSAFSTKLPIAGNDMDILGAWTSGYSGKGIKVAVVDSGLEVAHEDLAANVDLANSHNFVTGTTDPTPATSYVGFDHGTQVAGIIGAIAFNGKGGRGVAYNATLRGYNLLAPGNTMLLTDYGLALGGASYSADTDIFNESFGSSGTSLLPYNNASIAINRGLTSLRAGKGAILVHSAGNDFLDWEYNDGTLASSCLLANQLGVSCSDPAHDPSLGDPTPIVVGATNARGVKASYSTTGSSVWVSAPGGESGKDVTYDSAASPIEQEPAIVTTARDGCQNALGAPQSFNGLDAQGANALANNCQYTARMNGTSSAAPNVSATVALMLEANQNLTSRDVKDILARTATRIDPTFAGVSSPYIVNGATVVVDQGWFQNAAGHWFSNWYGFGQVDAGAAVTMAKTYTMQLPPVQSAIYTYSPPQNLTVPAASSTGSSISISAAPPFSTVEQLVLELNLTSSPALYCNQIEMYSPSGTKSILLHTGNGFYSSGLYQSQVSNALLLTNAFYGEPSTGTWTMKIYDFCASSLGATVIATTDVEAFIIVGH